VPELEYATSSYEPPPTVTGGFHAAVFANHLSGDAPALISLDADGEPLQIDFINGVYDLDVGYSDLFFSRHLMSFGGNIRYNTFDFNIAPGADVRRQAGIYVQDEIDLRRFRLALSLRADTSSTTLTTSTGRRGRR